MKKIHTIDKKEKNDYKKSIADFKFIFETRTDLLSRLSRDQREIIQDSIITEARLLLKYLEGHLNG